jgi:autotransporter-associated beta strand protein
MSATGQGFHMKKYQAIRQSWRAVVVGVGLLWTGSVVPAATLTWNGGVAGVWTSNGGGWLDGVSPATWNSGTPDSAIFGSASAGSLTLDAAGITAAVLSVTAQGYIFDGAAPLVLAGGTIAVDAGITARVNAVMGGTGFNKTGDGLLVFSNANKNYAGPTIISNGALQVLGSGAGLLGATSTQGVTLAGGRLQGLFGSSVNWSNFITVGAAGGELRNLGGDTQRWGFNSGRILGSGVLTLSYGANNTRFQISSGQTGFTGKWVLDSGGNQNRFVDSFTSTAFGGATGSDAITLINSGTLSLRDTVTLGSVTQGVLLGSGQSRIAVTDNSTAVVAAAISGPVTNTLLLVTGSTTNSLLILTNTANSWLGETTLSGSGIVRVGQPGVFPDAGGNVVLNSSVRLDLNGHSEAIGGLFGTGRVENQAAGASVLLTVGGNNNSPTFSGIIANSGAGSLLSLLKVGSGTQSLGGTNFFNGSVVVEQGVLALSGVADFAVSTSITVKAGATLQSIGRNDGTLTVPVGQVLDGDGVLIGILTNRGVVSPGWPVGGLTLTGNYSQAASGTLRIAIAGASSFDVLQSSGAALLNGALDVVLDSYTPVSGDEFRVARFASRTGGFATTNLPGLSSGLGWTVTYLSTGVVLAVTGAPPVSGYGAWSAEITNGQTNYGESATNDGYPNLLKYATGSSPTNSDLLANLGAVRNGGVLSLLFNRNTNAVDVTLIVEASAGLTNDASWVGIATNVAGVWSPPVAVETGVVSPLSVQVPDSASGDERRFMRLRVTIP